MTMTKKDDDNPYLWAMLMTVLYVGIDASLVNTGMEER